MNGRTSDATRAGNGPPCPACGGHRGRKVAHPMRPGPDPAPWKCPSRSSPETAGTTAAAPWIRTGMSSRGIYLAYRD